MDAFPARGGTAPVDAYWYDGHWQEGKTGETIHNRPKRPEGIPEDRVLGGTNSNGSFFAGDKGVVTIVSNRYQPGP